ncbi:hypothetical protein ACFZAV_43310 [Streptomyces sp. NPDC008343]|uniref:hypothetical protein n=1 Tax=Streptomyces sp. NPDC008343 TaxID=3364828 RepID=UPI0036E3308E
MRARLRRSIVTVGSAAVVAVWLPSPAHATLSAPLASDCKQWNAETVAYENYKAVGYAIDAGETYIHRNVDRLPYAECSSVVESQTEVWGPEISRSNVVNNCALPKGNTLSQTVKTGTSYAMSKLKSDTREVTAGTDSDWLRKTLGVSISHKQGTTRQTSWISTTINEQWLTLTVTGRVAAYYVVEPGMVRSKGYTDHRYWSRSKWGSSVTTGFSPARVPFTADTPAYKGSESQPWYQNRVVRLAC